MSLLLDAPVVPLREDEQGVLRVGGTRVTLQTVVTAYERGSTPEQLVQDFDSLSLNDVYAVINFYLHNRDAVEEYLSAQRTEADEVRTRIEGDPDQQEFRHRLAERTR